MFYHGDVSKKIHFDFLGYFCGCLRIALLEGVLSILYSNNLVNHKDFDIHEVMKIRHDKTIIFLMKFKVKEISTRFALLILLRSIIFLNQ